MAAWEFQALQNVASRNGWHQFISMQNYYNLIGREEEREMIPLCADEGVGTGVPDLLPGSMPCSPCSI